MIKKILIMMGLTASAGFLSPIALADDGNSIGQTLKIRTNLRTFLGKPAWLLIVRDVDHNQNIPYLYDFTTGSNYWMALTYGTNYLITVSEVTFNPYERKIKNFCNLESMGAIQHGVSLDIHLTGDLSPHTNSYSCNVMKYTEPSFSLPPQDE